MTRTWTKDALDRAHAEVCGKCSTCGRTSLTKTPVGGYVRLSTDSDACPECHQVDPAPAKPDYASMSDEQLLNECGIYSPEEMAGVEMSDPSGALRAALIAFLDAC